ncbi:monofunctional biosynthetic peptidoglycan transglycosylase [Parabacteroides sp. Marseille-P3160]|uniref:monofunctional biosynthetic peptidoglycan transglycosylase n=1 Tax=Parabacteroides sp. Marseille-P3160 TaxID=1917887 RepID=UPI0009BA2210|nr:monofunctional biosynthetic peptidoglycan transglycosylase [Parabacteroides sp. Marseille-P3160]
MKRLLRWCRNLALFLFFSSLAMVVIYRFIPVYFTPLMFVRLYEQMREDKPLKLSHHWIPMDLIPQALAQAVVASEDNRFLEHSGFDLKEIKKARKEARQGRRVRGASTISQQTAKNVFLLPHKSYLRKGFEAYFTFLIELLWSKERIMEVYLNSIEMGDGIYGAEAVALAHFNKSAYRLTRSECALIAATLPNPRRFNSARPSRYMLQRQGAILSLMRKLETVDMGYNSPSREKIQKQNRREK